MHYTGTIWRPPYEASSLLIEVTAGCTHHKCKFCTLYNDLPFKFRMSPLKDVEEDLQEASNQYKLWKNYKVTRTFLTGANPFVLKTERLIQIAELITKYFPDNRTIGCFSRVTDVKMKTDEELKALKRTGYDGLTIGIETGDDAALEFMDKGYMSKDIVEQCRRLDDVGIHYNFFYLTGISGTGRGEEGARATAGVCNQLHPELIGASMLTVYPEAKLYQEIAAENWKAEGEIEKYKELKVLIEELNIPIVFASLGASNAIHLQGRLPKDRKKLLKAVEEIIENVSEEELINYRKNLRSL